MIYKTIDLYEYFGEERPQYAVGRLSCMCVSPLPGVNPDRRNPAVLIIPGGAYAWVSGREAEPIAFHYLKSGYSAFVLDYAVAPAAYPVAFREAAMAVMYIREQSAALSVAPDMVTAVGFSAGGHLCGCLAVLTGNGVLDDLTAGREYSPRPDAVILGYPVITTGADTHEDSANNISGGDPELRRYLSLERRVDGTAVPAFIFHTCEDVSVPPANSLMLALAYERAGVPFALHIFEKGGHGMSTFDACVYRSDSIPPHSTRIEDWLDMSVRWLEDRGLRITD